MDVFDLTKSYKSLDKVLKNNKVTAEGLAEILEQITDGTVKIDELTNTVLAAMSSFESLNSIAAKSVKFFEDFDLGIDESTVGESIVEFGDLIIENMERGAVGNSQNFRILDTLFPGWDDDITTAEARIAEMARLGNLLKGNG
jgi:F0F1-type ATP synthase delta subunit